MAQVRLSNESSQYREAKEIDENETTDEKESVTRETWGREFEFLLSIVGYTVGFGSIWRFPYLCYRNGGGAFFIPFILFLVICGGPMYYMELSLGQFSGKSTVQVFDFCPMMRGVGVVMTSAATIGVITNGLVFAWIGYYLVRSFYPVLGWASCDNEWNTPQCIDSTRISLLTNDTVNMTNDHNLTVRGTTPADEFWIKVVLHQSDGIEDFGHINWHLLASAFIFWMLIFLCLFKGIESLGKVIYVTVLAPYLLLTALLVRGLTLDGGLDGIRMYLYPDFSRLLYPQIWLEAALQVFYSLGPGWGSIITMASFNKFKANTLRPAIIVCAADFFTAFFCGLVVFSMIGVLSKVTGDKIDEMPFSGPSLAFVAYPEALARLPFPNLWSVMFFLTLVFIGIDSTFAMTESVSNTIVDLNYARFRRYRTHITFLVILVFFLIGIVSCFSNGIYIFQLSDWYVGSFNVTIASLLECICVAWVYGVNRFSSDIEMMRGSRPSLFLRTCWLVIVPIFLVGLVVMAILYYSPPTGQNGYVYPTAAVAFGNMIALVPLLAVPGYALFDILYRHGSLTTRIANGMRASVHWQPKGKESHLQQKINGGNQPDDLLLGDMLGVESKI